MTINGLLQYAIEEEYKPFKKSIRNLAECDEYDEIVVKDMSVTILDSHNYKYKYPLQIIISGIK